MRTILTGELAQAQSFDSDYYVKLEVQNASGTWIDIGAALGTHWIVNARWGEVVDTAVSQATFTLLQQIGAASLSPLMAGSPLNVDDLGAYAPLLDIGRLVRASVATMPHLTALDVSKYRRIFDGRVNKVSQADEAANPMRITLECADLGSWLMDMQVETSGVQYGTTPVGTALETVVQNVLTATIPVGEPAVTLVKQSASAFAVTDWQQGEGKLLEGLIALVLDSTGEDLRYRYDASHVSQLMWFNPDRTRVTVDATFAPKLYVLRTLDLDIVDIRNAGEMPYEGGVASKVAASSIKKYRRRFFRLAASNMITTLAEAQTVIDAVVNDLSAPPGEAAADLPCFFWPVQLYDRYTFQANARQYDADQTFAVMGYEHAIESGVGSTTLTLTARVVGAYAAWVTRLRMAQSEALGELGNVQWEVAGGVTTVTFERTARVTEVWAAASLAAAADAPDWDALASAVAPLPDGAVSLIVPTPADGQVTLVQLEPRHADLTPGAIRRLLITATPQVPHFASDDYETDTVGTQLIRLTERGIAVTLVEVRTQIGTQPISAWGPPLRVAGATSSIPGHGVLVAGEYEHDTVLDPSRGSFITFRYTLENGAQITTPDYFFDRDKNPNLVSVVPVGDRKLSVLGDVDTKSMQVFEGEYPWAAGRWKKTFDGLADTVDVAVTDVNGVAGLGSAAAKLYTVIAYAAATGYIDGTTPFDKRTLTVSGPTAPPPSSAWDTVFATAPFAPPTGTGVDTVTLQLKATAAPLGWTVKVYYGADVIGGTPDPTTDITASLSPVPATVPTALTSYTYGTGYPATRGIGAQYVTARIRADLLDNLGVVQDTRTVQANWGTP